MGKRWYKLTIVQISYGVIMDIGYMSRYDDDYQQCFVDILEM
jgi:hypothetical protein